MDKIKTVLYNFFYAPYIRRQKAKQEELKRLKHELNIARTILRLETDLLKRNILKHRIHTLEYEINKAQFN